MKDSKKRWGPYIAAALLASLTIRVFYELQHYGPESAIRRYNEATRGRIRPALGHASPEQAMVLSLHNWFVSGVTMSVERVRRTGDQVRAVVVFSFPPINAYPKGIVWGCVWVVERRKNTWMVDEHKTAAIFWDSSPPAYPL